MIYYNVVFRNICEMATTNGNAEGGKAIRSNAIQGKSRQSHAMQRKALHGKASSDVRSLHSLPKSTGLVSDVFDIPRFF